MEFVWIEPGTFVMGSPSSEPGRWLDEGPQHHVTISQGFYLGRHEISQAQWTRVMGTTPWSARNHVRSDPNRPAVHISWGDLQEFVERVNAVAREELYRCPTEAEWEYACRAGTTTRWSFGDDQGQLGEHAWYDENAWAVGDDHAHAVGTKLPNPWGLYDMHGNVGEWCQDWYGTYASGEQSDPSGPANGSERIFRGGHFSYYAQNTRSAFRNSISPGDRVYFIGARLLRTK